MPSSWMCSSSKSRSMPTATTRTPSSWATSTSAPTRWRRAGEASMPLHRCSDSLAMSGLSASSTCSASVPTDRSSSEIDRAALAVGGDELRQQLDVARSARRPSARGRCGRLRRRRARPAAQTARSELSTSSTARGSSLTNSSSPSGRRGRPASSTAARARASKEKSASWTSAASSSSCPRTSTLPMRPRISASRP